ncbi:macrolide 2'-phosphotransferase [Pseudarthrobacter sp. BRE9]|uniref:macrolide 2'-phosphotransferase n=1 Tax=Pseudarthrobacter sp. BRE9 TaxID=2962582 RepID=UPI0028827A6C|nr:macrolide 2'-phosphotransferase [Pseudarthrobacter sp. BRE9]MDT0167689.1 macrolide 2'-phosphotransferase [Pseudarthrobacter sp. BRE9]
MRRKPIELAAIATAAVPGLTPTAVSSAPDDPADFDSALLLDSEGKRWRVRSPRHAEASARLETEFLVLRAFAPAVRAELPFLMPTVAGSVRLGTLTTFVYSHLAGTTRSVEELTSGPAGLAREIGSALAAVHDLPRSLVSNADLPSYTPNEFRQRRLNELDQAATTGKIPAALLRRWEHAMEDVSLWRFNPCVVHGDLHEDNLLVDAGRVTAVTGWTDLRIGDPADDFAWLVASNEQDFIDAVLKAYTSSRRDVPDQHLLRRAALSAEFALAQYLVKGLAAGDQDMVSEAEDMLESLASDIAEYGGQPISVEPLPATGGPNGPGASVPASAAGSGTASDSGTATASGGGSSAVTPAVTVVPVPAQPAAPAELVVPAPLAAPAQPAGQAQPTAPVVPAAPAQPAVSVRPAVHITPIPVEVPPAGADSAEVTGAETKGPDDTSTAAISVVNAKQG